MAFAKVLLATGEPRADFIQRRLTEKASVKDILDEINASGMYSGIEGKTWPETVVLTEQRKLAKAAEPKSDEDAPVKAMPAVVPAEFEGVLTSQDMADIRAEAAAALRKKSRAAARKEALAKATLELEQEARLAELRGAARGDLIDITIDLAPYTDHIKLDGRVFMHGTTHRVLRKVAAVLEEQMQRSWQHQEGLSGKNENAYRRSVMQRRGTVNQAAVNGVRA